MDYCVGAWLGQLTICVVDVGVLDDNVGAPVGIPTIGILEVQG
jgi:hypothetical protein